jgi:hypothetical protein
MGESRRVFRKLAPESQSTFHVGVVQLGIARAQGAWLQVLFAGMQICHQGPTVVGYFEFEPGNLTSSGRRKERQHDIS